MYINCALRTKKRAWNINVLVAAAKGIKSLTSQGIFKKSQSVAYTVQHLAAFF